jgi:hypothetical protein
VHRLQSPQRSEIGRASGVIPDAQLTGKAAQLGVPANSWGGVYRASTGEPVTVYASNAYPVDPAIGQRWADFLASLIHGSEISSVTVYLAPDSQISELCGQDAVACYSSRDSLLIAPGDDPSSDLSAEAVITHEYGHHIAAHRENTPWAAVDYGTKRWASAMQVCARTKKGDLAPGAEDPVRYETNPGEGFAESYRVLNERSEGRAETPWRIVSEALYPSDAALAALNLDVTSPWLANATSTLRGRVTRATRVRTYTVATPLDGRFGVTLRAGGATRYSLDVLSGTTRLGHSAGARLLGSSTSVCGQRTLRIRVRALKGSGSFSLALSKP